MFTIKPFAGPLPLKFGMTPEEVALVLGPPDRSLPPRFGSFSESRKRVSVGYDATSRRLMEVVFAPGSDVSYEGQDLFASEDVIAFLRRFDPHPKAAVGMVFFVDLGLRLSGFHDGDEGQKAIAVSTKGRWDEFRDTFERFEPKE